MPTKNTIPDFLSSYSEEIQIHAYQLREVLLAELPNITEQVDLTSKMIAYAYGQKYSQLICVVIPSKKGLKLGFNRGTELADPDKLLEGTGKISRYVVITSEEQIRSSAIKNLIQSALKRYHEFRDQSENSGRRHEEDRLV